MPPYYTNSVRREMRKCVSLFLLVIGCVSLIGCGDNSATSAPSANEYEAYLAEHPEAAQVMSDDSDQAQ
jgi:hypothetical protein